MYRPIFVPEWCVPADFRTAWTNNVPDREFGTSIARLVLISDLRYVFRTFPSDFGTIFGAFGTCLVGTLKYASVGT